MKKTIFISEDIIKKLKIWMALNDVNRTGLSILLDVTRQSIWSWITHDFSKGKLKINKTTLNKIILLCSNKNEPPPDFSMSINDSYKKLSRDNKLKVFLFILELTGGKV